MRLGGLGDAYYQRGWMMTAHRHFHDCVELSRSAGFGRIEVANLSMIGFTLRYANEFHKALKIACDTVEAAARVGIAGPSSSAGSWRSICSWTWLTRIMRACI